MRLALVLLIYGSLVSRTSSLNQPWGMSAEAMGVAPYGSDRTRLGGVENREANAGFNEQSNQAGPDQHNSEVGYNQHYAQGMQGQGDVAGGGMGTGGGFGGDSYQPQSQFPQQNPYGYQWAGQSGGTHTPYPQHRGSTGEPLRLGSKFRSLVSRVKTAVTTSTPPGGYQQGGYYYPQGGSGGGGAGAGAGYYSQPSGWRGEGGYAGQGQQGQMQQGGSSYSGQAQAQAPQGNQAGYAYGGEAHNAQQSHEVPFGGENFYGQGQPNSAYSGVSQPPTIVVAGQYGDGSHQSNPPSMARQQPTDAESPPQQDTWASPTPLGENQPPHGIAAGITNGSTASLQQGRAVGDGGPALAQWQEIAPAASAQELPASGVGIAESEQVRTPPEQPFYPAPGDAGATQPRIFQQEPRLEPEQRSEMGWAQGQQERGEAEGRLERQQYQEGEYGEETPSSPGQAGLSSPPHGAGSSTAATMPHADHSSSVAQQVSPGAAEKAGGEPAGGGSTMPGEAVASAADLGAAGGEEGEEASKGVGTGWGAELENQVLRRSSSPVAGPEPRNGSGLGLDSVSGSVSGSELGLGSGSGSPGANTCDQGSSAPLNPASPPPDLFDSLSSHAAQRAPRGSWAYVPEGVMHHGGELAPGARDSEFGEAPPSSPSSPRGTMTSTPAATVASAFVPELTAERSLGEQPPLPLASEKEEWDQVGEEEELILVRELESLEQEMEDLREVTGMVVGEGAAVEVDKDVELEIACLLSGLKEGDGGGGGSSSGHSESPPAGGGGHGGRDGLEQEGEGVLQHSSALEGALGARVPSSLVQGEGGNPHGQEQQQQQQQQSPPENILGSSPGQAVSEVWGEDDAGFPSCHDFGEMASSLPPPLAPATTELGSSLSTGAGTVCMGGVEEGTDPLGGVVDDSR
ncbi:unnamed protein product, partial [Discosporangium mesarthrocarpum]